MKTIYIDVLFLVNLIVNAMIYLSACMMLRRRVSWWRILIAAAVGAVLSCAVFLTATPPLLSNTFAVALYIVCTYLVMGFGNLREFIKNVVSTLLCAFVFAGVFFLLYRYFDFGSVMVFNNNVLYIDIPVFVLLCVSFGCFGAISLISRCFTRVVSTGTEYTVEIVIAGKHAKAQALLDTGNRLTDGVLGTPVVLCERRILASILPPGVLEFAGTGIPDRVEDDFKSRVRVVSYSTVAAGGLLRAVRPDYLVVTGSGKTITVHNVLIGITDQKIGQGENYGMLLSAHIFKEEDDHEPIVQKNRIA